MSFNVWVKPSSESDEDDTASSSTSGQKTADDLLRVRCPQPLLRATLLWQIDRLPLIAAFEIQRSRLGVVPGVGNPSFIIHCWRGFSKNKDVMLICLVVCSVMKR